MKRFLVVTLFGAILCTALTSYHDGIPPISEPVTEQTLLFAQIAPPEHKDHMDYYAWAAEYSMGKEREAMQRGVKMFVRPQITDDPKTWPSIWGEADKDVLSCSSTGKNNGGTKQNPTNCRCFNECIKQGLEPGVPEFATRHGDPRCKTTCRASSCKCKPPCI